MFFFSDYHKLKLPLVVVCVHIYIVYYIKYLYVYHI